MTRYNIHSDFKKYENTRIPLFLILLPLINSILVLGSNITRSAEGVKAVKKRIPGYQNGMIRLTIFEPKNIENNAPCLVYFHGGAFALKAAPYHKKLACKYALKTPCKVVFVDYRLAPRYAFPVGVEDCYAAFEWVCKNAEDLGIDRSRIAVGGDSAGGALAAAVSLMARDRKAPAIFFQMLIYPVTDARQITGSIKNYIDTPLWNSRLNEKMWRQYLKEGIRINREYASPMEAASLGNLPESYVEVAEFDCLRDEGINFAEALQAEGTPVELHKITGAIHGFDIAEKSEIVQQMAAGRIQALKRVFYKMES
ncbi:MAG: alpha/beta hydrolase [Eubacteriales bacterium]